MKSFLFILFLITPGGEIKSTHEFMTECPDKPSVETTMQSWMDQKKIIAWQAICIKAMEPGTSG